MNTEDKVKTLATKAEELFNRTKEDDLEYITDYIGIKNKEDARDFVYVSYELHKAEAPQNEKDLKAYNKAYEYFLDRLIEVIDRYVEYASLYVAIGVFAPSCYNTKNNIKQWTDFILDGEELSYPFKDYIDTVLRNLKSHQITINVDSIDNFDSSYFKPVVWGVKKFEYAVDAVLYGIDIRLFPPEDYKTAREYRNLLVNDLAAEGIRA